MKAFSLYQPFATLIVNGYKSSFSYSRTMRKKFATLAIHAASKHHPHAEQFAERPAFKAALRKLGFADVLDMPTGQVLGYCTIRDTVERHRLTSKEVTAYMAFADFEPAKWIWHLENPIRFSKPIPFKGRPAMFDVPDQMVIGAMPNREEAWLHEDDNFLF